MNSKDRYDTLRSGKKKGITLRMSLVLAVALELEISILIAVGIGELLGMILNLPFEIPMLVQLLGISLVVSLMITSQLSKYFLTPIRRLRSAMGRVANGDFSVRLEEKSTYGEILEIYTGFNLMVEELSATEILQTDVISNVSHEFKTPISAIEGYSTLLQDSTNLEPRQREYIEKILLNTKRLSGLMGSILLLSKLENQQIPSNQVTYRLDEQIRQSVVAQETTWESKNLELDVELDRLTYFGNEQMMRHVWDNLLSNAIKFSPDGGKLTLRLKEETGKRIFTLDDQGPGLSDTELKRIFDKFYQGDSSHKQEGNGLGLALVKRILSIEKGQVIAENLPEGGCRFTVTLRS